MLTKFIEEETNYIPLTGNRYSYKIDSGVKDELSGCILEPLTCLNGKIVSVDFGRGPEEWDYGVLVSLATKRCRLPYQAWRKLRVMHVDGDRENFHPKNLVWKFPPEGIEGPIPGFYYIPGYSYYCINREGELYSNATRKLLSAYIDSYGYLIYGVTPDVGNRSICSQHRLLALTFLEYPATVSRLDVNHKNGIKRNNVLGNLEWISRKGNCDHAYETGLRDDNIAVLVKNIFTDEVKKFRSISQAGAFFKCHSATLMALFKQADQFLRAPGLLLKKESCPDKWLEIKNPEEEIRKVTLANPVQVKDLETGSIREFKNASEAAVFLEFSIATVKNRLSGKHVPINSRYQVTYSNYEDVARSLFTEM